MKLRKDGVTYNFRQTDIKFSKAKIDMPISKAEYKFFRNEGKKRISQMLNNPLYLRNVFQYCFGGFYQAVMGILSLWNIKADKHMTEILGRYLKAAEETNSYWVKAFKILKPSPRLKILQVKGIPWTHGFSTPPFSMHLKYIDNYFFKTDSFLFIRRNHMDGRLYHDVEGYCQKRKSVVLLRVTGQHWLSMQDKIDETPLTEHRLGFNE